MAASEDMNGKVCVITGASGGIGRETALIAAERAASPLDLEQVPGIDRTVARTIYDFFHDNKR